MGAGCLPRTHQQLRSVREEWGCFGGGRVGFGFYESIKGELHKRLIFDSRCDVRLTAKTEGYTRLTYTMWREEP